MQERGREGEAQELAVITVETSCIRASFKGLKFSPHVFIHFEGGVFFNSLSEKSVLVDVVYMSFLMSSHLSYLAS